jgi:hypothetical protein
LNSGQFCASRVCRAPPISPRTDRRSPPASNLCDYGSTTLLTSYRIVATYRISSLVRGVSGDDPEGGAGIGVPGRGRNRAPGGSGDRAQNRQGGAPRGPSRFASGRPRLANVVFAPYERDRMRIPPPGAPPAPSRGRRRRRGSPPTPRLWRACTLARRSFSEGGKRENPGAATRRGNEETALFDIVKMDGARSAVARMKP